MSCFNSGDDSLFPSPSFPPYHNFFRLSLHAFRDSRISCHCHCHLTWSLSKPTKQLTSQIRHILFPHQWVSSARPPTFHRPSLPKSLNSICLNEPLPHLSRPPRHRSVQVRRRKWIRPKRQLLYLRGLKFSRECPPSRPVTWACSFTWTTYPDCITYLLLFLRGYYLLVSLSSPGRSQASRTPRHLKTAIATR